MGISPAAPEERAIAATRLGPGPRKEGSSIKPLLVLLCALILTGCQLYWTKPGGFHGNFHADHKDCVIAAGRPIPNDDRLLVLLDLYRACLKSRGWERVTASKAGVPVGYFRGQEDEGPVRPDDAPKQPPTHLAPARAGRGSSTNFGPR